MDDNWGYTPKIIHLYKCDFPLLTYINHPFWGTPTVPTVGNPRKNPPVAAANPLAQDLLAPWVTVQPN